MSWQLLTAISVVALSVSVLLQRILLHNDKLDPYAYAVIFQGMVGVLLIIVTIPLGFKLPNIENLLVQAVVSVVAFGLGHIAYAKTLQRVEASAFSVLFATQAVWIMLAGIVLFHESLTVLQVVGSLLIFSSVILLARNLRSLTKDTGTLLGLLTGILFGIAIVCWSYVGRHTDGMSWAAISFFGTSLVAFLAQPKTIHAMRPILTGKLFPKLFLLCILYAIGSVAMLYAYQKGTFAVVTPLRQTSIVVTVLLALLFLPKERNRVWLKLAAAIVSLGGVLLILV